MFVNYLPRPATGTEWGVGEKCIMRSSTICRPNFSINAVSDLSFIIYRPDREDSTKMRVKLLVPEIYIFFNFSTPVYKM